MRTTLLLALGNDIMGDDAVGLIAGRIVNERFHNQIDYSEVALSGIDLLEEFSGYNNVLLLDAILTEKNPPGTIYQFSPDDFTLTDAQSPHGSGLAEAFQLARELSLPLPENFRVLAMEVHDLTEIRTGLNQEIEAALPVFTEQASAILQGWLND
jgi:hydrogenase maturation protease